MEPSLRLLGGDLLFFHLVGEQHHESGKHVTFVKRCEPAWVKHVTYIFFSSAKLLYATGPISRDEETSTREAMESAPGFTARQG